ncbi:MAG: hypothetical protein IJK31_08135 [Ruminococcus sp.]|nr:hypothetical protein [Ruminococcus sp.]HRR75552.1 hypothetical protein [Ruminococcus sp.]
MKNPIIAKSAAILIAASMSLALASCGDSDSSSKSEKKGSSAVIETEAPTEAEELIETETVAELTGTDQTWGIFSVMVPDGWTLKGGDFFDENDPEMCSVKKSDFSYFDIKSEKENVQMQKYENNKNTYTNEQKDIPATTLGDIEWNGFQYGNDFGGGFELYGQSGGRFLRVSCAGFSFDSPEAQAILGSLKVSPAEADESAPAEDAAE